MFIDKIQTKNFYDNYSPCDCDCCKNFVLQIEQAYPLLSKFFEDNAVDITKPWELMSVASIDVDKMVDYFDCQYLIFGNCEKDFETEIDGVKIEQTFVHPSTKNYPQPNFVVSFSISLKNIFLKNWFILIIFDF